MVRTDYNTIELYDIIQSNINDITDSQDQEYIDNLLEFIKEHMHIDNNIDLSDDDIIEFFLSSYQKIIYDMQNMEPSDAKSVHQEIHHIYQNINNIWTNLYNYNCNAFNPSNNYTLKDLKLFAKYCKLPGYSTMNKEQLYNLLTNYKNKIY
jgi:hypothetical protein